MIKKSTNASKFTVRNKFIHNRSTNHDVIVVGGGPAGSVMAWQLAKCGVNVLLIDKNSFPREKVCGDFLEPRGLRILDKMGLLKSLEKTSPQPITHVSMFLEGICAYRDRIPFYSEQGDLPSHGYILPREELDYHLIQCSAEAGAIIHEETVVKGFTTSDSGVTVEVQRGKRRSFYKAKLIVGADGTHSIIAKGAGLDTKDPRYIAVAQRCYAEGVRHDIGEAIFFFDQDLSPGYGWAFPMVGGRANVGVGILAEARERYQINVPQLFNEFIAKLKRSDPNFLDIHISKPPIGGIVKTYGGIGSNYFDGGILIGDAGSFVDPMTGEGITTSMESALIGSTVLIDSLESGSFDAESLSAFQHAFRQYFDPSMVYLDFCAALMRNRNFSASWLNAVAHGCKLAQNDPDFALTAGASFGGLEVDPIGILTEIWVKTLTELNTVGSQSMFDLFNASIDTILDTMSDLIVFQLSWWESIMDDPIWHANWITDIEQKWFKLLETHSKKSSYNHRGEGVQF